MPSDSAAPLQWRLGLLLFFAVLVLSIPQAALMPLLDRDEPRFAEATREMLQSGNIVVPTFNHEPRYAKPPLIYWCQAISFTLFGENAFAARLPSLLATAATAMLLLTWCTRLGSVEIGFSAAVCYALCFQAIQQGRVATADALLIFFMTLTAFAGWMIIRPKVSDGCNGICFFVLTLGFAGGFLAKGPEALLPFLPLLWCARKNGAGVLIKLSLSFLAGLGLVFIWAIPAYIETNGEYWKVGLGHDVIDRMAGGDFQGHGASTRIGYLVGLIYYPLLFWLSALPWSPLLVTQRKKLFSGWKPDAVDLYLLLNAGLIFLVFTFMVTKLPHYTLPAFPFLALCFARRWRLVGLSPHFLTKLGWRMGIVFALVALVGIPIALNYDATPSPVGQLVRDARGVLTPATEFAVVDFQEPNVIWEMRRVVKGYGKSISETQVESFLNKPGPRAIVISTPLWEKVGGLLDPAGSPLKTYQSSGINAAKVKFLAPLYIPMPEPLDLTLVVKP